MGKNNKSKKSKKHVSTSSHAQGSSVNNNHSDADSNNSKSASLTTSTYDNDESNNTVTSWEQLGLNETLCEACSLLKWENPTPVQTEAIPYALQGRDIIGLAETGSGKTAAFALPILQALLENPRPYFGVILSPTRELALQIKEQFDALGSIVHLKTCAVVGGVDSMQQKVDLMKKPHIIIATPGKLMYHLQTINGFSLKNAKFCVLDEADRMLSMDFTSEIRIILDALPKNRTTFLFSATMTKKVNKLQRAALKDPVKVEVSKRNSTVDKLVQSYLFMPEHHKDCYLAFLLTELAGKTIIVFTSTCAGSMKLAMMLKLLGMNQVLPLSGKMEQKHRLRSLNRFKAGKAKVLICTDVASRGLDIPAVDVVINYDIPKHSKDYIHRVGRTARAGRSGQSITFVSQYDIEYFQRIESLIGLKMSKYNVNEDQVMVLMDTVKRAQQAVNTELKRAGQTSDGKKRKKHSKVEFGDDDNEEVLNDTLAQLARPKKRRRLFKNK